MARGSLAWWNGEFLPIDKVKISPFSHGLHYGTGVFEGIRAYKQKKGGGAIFRLTEHMQRFHDSFKIERKNHREVLWVQTVDKPSAIDRQLTAELSSERYSQHAQLLLVKIRMENQTATRVSKKTQKIDQQFISDKVELTTNNNK